MYTLKKQLYTIVHHIKLKLGCRGCHFPSSLPLKMNQLLFQMTVRLYADSRVTPSSKRLMINSTIFPEPAHMRW